MALSQDSKLPAAKYERVNGNANAAKTPSKKYAIACAILASMNSILLGYGFTIFVWLRPKSDDNGGVGGADVGVMSGAIMFIQEDLHITEVQEEALVGSLNIVSLLGASVAGVTSDAIGRRRTMALAALIFLMGAAVMGLAPSFLVLMGGRLLAGIGVGFALMIAPVYTAEVSPASSRGALTCLPEIFINVGILLGYISNFLLSGLPAHLNWRWMLGLGAVPSVFLGLGVLAMPESPRWLVMRNRIEEATAVLQRTSQDEAEADARLAEIVEAAGNAEKSGRGSRGEGVWRELLRPSPPIRRMLIIALGIQFFQQASGIDATVYYSPTVFREAGIRSRAGLLGATVAVGFAKTGFILVAAFLIDKFGRRPLLLASAVGMSASLAALGLGFSFLENAPGSHGGAAFLAVLAVCCSVGFFSVGLGPVCWVLCSEIFPLRLRAQAGSLCVVVNRVVSGVVAMTFLSVSDAITIAGTFFLFAAVLAVCVIFIYGCVPETKGKTLEEIGHIFHEVRGELELGDAANLVQRS